MAQQQLESSLTAFTKDLQTQDKQKQQLISVLLEDTDSSSKLSKLRRLLLGFKVTSDSEFTPDVPSVLKDSISSFTPDQMRCFFDTFNTTIEPLRIHQDLLNNIGSVIKSKDLSADQKIEQISDLFI